MPIVKWRTSEVELSKSRLGLFRAEYDGRCANCPAEITKGDMIGFNPNRRVICSDCCESLPSGGNWRTTSNKDPEDESVIPESLVMPRGRTASDICTRCFLIHSSAQNDCE